MTVTLILPACGNNRDVDNDDDDDEEEEDDNDLLLIDLLVVAIFIYSFISCVGCDVLYGSGRYLFLHQLHYFILLVVFKF